MHRAPPAAFRIAPSSLVLVGIVLAVLSLFVARIYLRRITIDTKPGLALAGRVTSVVLEREPHQTALGVAALVAAAAGLGLAVLGLLGRGIG